MKERLKVLIRTMTVAIVGTVVVSPAVRAQRGSGGHTGFGVSHGDGFGRRGGWRTGAAYFPLFYDDDYDYGPDVVEPPPQTIVVQAPQAAASQTVAPAAPAEPLVIELRGDRWVRLKGYDEPQAPGVPAGLEPTTAVSKSSSSPSVLPSAVLVFRDGHQEEIAKYVIVGSTIYARADYWNSGSWTHKVALAELDIPATLQANEQRGAQFRLPSSPIEVVMRP